MKDNRDGKTYKTVKIGNQWWMAENLAFNTGTGCWTTDNNYYNVDKYGYLYNYQTATSVCPNGWHLPSDYEWTQLEEYIISVDATISKDRNGWTNMGKLLKSKSGWEHNENGTDQFGFNALPAGGHTSYSSYGGIGCYARWWSNTGAGKGAIKRYLTCYDGALRRGAETCKTDNISVRCIKD